MDYFDDLNPYLVKEDDNENLTRQQTVPPTQPVEQTYVENILRVNVGKKGTFYFSYTGSKTWNDKIYTGTLQQAGRDHFIIVTDTGKTVMLLLVYLLWAEFDEPLDYQYILMFSLHYFNSFLIGNMSSLTSFIIKISNHNIKFFQHI